MNAAATRSTDGSSVQVLVYNHVSGGAADPTKFNVVSLTLNNLPFTSGSVRIRQYIVDYAHANSYRAWVAMGSPARPTQAQWVTLSGAAELCYYETVVQPTGGSYTFQYAQGIYGVDLFQITAELAELRSKPGRAASPTRHPGPGLKGSTWRVDELLRPLGDVIPGR